MTATPRGAGAGAGAGADAGADLLALARELGPRLAVGAAQHDRDGTFPHEHFEWLRESGYTRATVPVEYGGWGCTLPEVLAAQLELAKGDGSTALAVGMHLMVCGTEGAVRAWPPAARARIFDAVVTGGALVNNIAAEPELGSPRGGGRPLTALSPAGDGRWRLDGHKTFSTLSPALTYLVTYVAIEDGSGDLGRVAVPASAAGVEVRETWDAIGMRSSGSHDVLFHDVALSDDDIVRRYRPGAAGAFSEAWFPLTTVSAYLGVAMAARDYAVEFARTRQPGGAVGPLATIPAVRQQVAEIDAALLAARALLMEAAHEWQADPSGGDAEGRARQAAKIAAAKRLAANTSIEVADRAMRLVGGVGLHRSEPLERYLRDVRGAPVNPPIEARALETIARAALDPVAPALPGEPGETAPPGT